jgi:putative hydrolase of the HAD superfamily
VHKFRKQFAEKFNLDYEEMNYRHKLLFVVLVEGRITLDEYLRRIVFYQKRDFSPQQSKVFLLSLTTANIKMIELIKLLKVANQLKIFAVSNETKEFNEYRIHKFKLTQFIDFLYPPAMFK